MFCAPVNYCEYTEFEMTAPQALGTKFRSANRGNPKTGRTVHQTEDLRLLTKLKSKVQSPNTERQFSAKLLCVQWCISMALRPNQPINRTCLRQAGYWRRWASGVAASKSP